MSKNFKQRSTPYRPASSYNALKPYLTVPIPAIKLKYFKPPTATDRRKHREESGMVCNLCNKPISVVGSANSITGKIYCDICAIKSYKNYEGFKTLAAAKAHRRRLFDTGYLLTEMLIDDYMAYHEIKIYEDLSDIEFAELNEVSRYILNNISKAKKIELQNNPDQSKIEKYYYMLIRNSVVIPRKRNI